MTEYRIVKETYSFGFKFKAEKRDSHNPEWTAMYHGVHDSEIYTEEYARKAIEDDKNNHEEPSAEEIISI